MARYLFPDIEIHAFEPLESERMIYETVVRPPAKLYPTALGCIPGEATFFVTSRADSSSLLQPAQIRRLGPLASSIGPRASEKWLAPTSRMDRSYVWSGSKLGRTQCERMFSGLRLKADIDVLTSAMDSKTSMPSTSVTR